MVFGGIGRVVRRAALPAMTRAGARIRGREDGRRGIPAGSHGGPAGTARPELIVTDYIAGLHALGAQAALDLRAALLHRERRLVAAIHREAVQVVTQYDIRQDPRPAALAAFGGRVGDWRTMAAVCRGRAEGITGRINQQIAAYWHGLRLGRLEQFNYRPPDDEDSVFPRHWRPAPMTLDPSWDAPDTWLGTGTGPGTGPGTGTAGGPATPRALHILRTQSTRGPIPLEGH
ncbi:hypothetical protein [Streptomyces aidingensis]|uniref:Uncharacterized protein n=1 Tax=Streptomyces aidingensis TaxID=910347 RepID=A0A1I1QUW9_9ACTN|nr:hypothetical protein [Streptomyces aidingensis]SFD25886.1 hypothetical protein SAMN05421773_11219 [Streptomyces aidingensis]